MRRRTTFAIPFVMIVATGCPGPVRTNPPPPRHVSAEECRALKEGNLCQGVRDGNEQVDPHYCSVESTTPTCGLQGYECTAGANNTYAWKADTKEACPVAPTPSEPVPATELH